MDLVTEITKRLTVKQEKALRTEECPATNRHVPSYKTHAWYRDTNIGAEYDGSRNDVPSITFENSRQYYTVTTCYNCGKTVRQFGEFLIPVTE